LELILVGTCVGIISGFFGVGGGMVLVPSLLFLGFDMQEAVAIAIMQMLFSSIYGTFLNYKKHKSILRDGFIIGIGGFIGGFQSSYIILNINSLYLQYFFILIVFLAILNIYRLDTSVNTKSIKHSKIALLFVGSIIGMIAMSVGVGGAVMLVPILTSFMKYNMKVAASLGLFFVVFSSSAGFISMTLNNMMPYNIGATIGIASLFGVYLGIKLKEKSTITSYKQYTLIMYLLISIAMIYNL